MNNEIHETKTETATKKENKPKKSYPFRTKRQILEQLETDDTFLVECLGILYQRQTTDEQETKETKYRNHRGFMSSHAVNGTRLAEKMLSGEEWMPEEWDKVRGIVCRYGKQLAAHFRAETLVNNPELAAQSACFFKPQPQS